MSDKDNITVNVTVSSGLGNFISKLALYAGIILSGSVATIFFMAKPAVFFGILISLTTVGALWWLWDTITGTKKFRSWWKKQTYPVHEEMLNGQTVLRRGNSVYGTDYVYLGHYERTSVGGGPNGEVFHSTTRKRRKTLPLIARKRQYDHYRHRD